MRLVYLLLGLLLIGSVQAQTPESLENVTLRLNFNLTDSDRVYFSGERISGPRSFTESDYPYFASEGDGFVSGIVANDFLKAERSIPGYNSFSLTRSREDPSFIIPYTRGSFNDIENRKDEVTEEEFLSKVDPSFGFFINEVPTVRVILDPDQKITSDINTGPGNYEFKTEKTVERKASIEVVR